MKKFAICAGLAAVLTLSACGGDTEEDQSEQQAPETEEAEKSEAVAEESNDNETENTEEASAEETEPEPEESEEPQQPAEISDYMIDNAVEMIESEDLVVDAAISPQDDGDGYNLAIIANDTITEDAAKELADSFVRNFASNVAMDTEYKGPTADSLGGMWDDYNLMVGVYNSAQEEIVLGAKSPVADKITW